MDQSYVRFVSVCGSLGIEIFITEPKPGFGQDGKTTWWQTPGEYVQVCHLFQVLGETPKVDDENQKANTRPGGSSSAGIAQLKVGV